MKFKITLKPIGPYFFGTERGYGENNKVSYFATSRKYPQQTTLLGMLRYRLLEMHGWLNDGKGNWGGSSFDDRKALIGPRSFKPDRAANRVDYGCIKRIGPVWLEQNGELLLPGNLDRGYSYQNHGGTVTLGGFDYKNSTQAHLTTASAKLDDQQPIFLRTERVGITKGRDDGDEKAFYKQENWQLAANTEFVFYTDLDEMEGKKLADFVTKIPTVKMGGENSRFRMIMIQADAPSGNDWTTYRTETDYDRLVCLSDTWLPYETQQEFAYGVFEPTFFRNIVTSSEKTKNFWVHPKKDRTDAPHKSGGYHLLRRGSVLYAPSERLEELIEQILEQTAGWQQIGYNHFVRQSGEDISYNIFKTP